jgi:hypothetical protein
MGDLSYWQGVFGDLDKFDESDNSVQKLATEFVATLVMINQNFMLGAVTKIFSIPLIILPSKT